MRLARGSRAEEYYSCAALLQECDCGGVRLAAFCVRIVSEDVCSSCSSTLVTLRRLRADKFGLDLDQGKVPNAKSRNLLRKDRCGANASGAQQGEPFSNLKNPF